MNIRSNAESISFYASKSTEKDLLNKEFHLLLSKTELLINNLTK
jgi:ABC-type uncharacterized transport system fused permease/ATPase subunit